jgi:hypothetical protein
VRRQLGGRQHHRAAGRRRRDQPRHQVAEIARLDRLGDVVHDVAAVDGLGEDVAVAVGRDQDPGGLRHQTGGALEQLDAGEAGHEVVGHDHADVALPDQLEGAGARGGRAQRPQAAQGTDEEVEVVGLVVDQQDLPGAGSAHLFSDNVSCGSVNCPCGDRQQTLR